MKKAIILVIFCYMTFTAHTALAADNYWVVFLKGSVFQTNPDKALKVGDKVASDIKLRFSAKDAYAVVMGPKGKFTLRPEINKSRPNEFVAFVNSALLPVKSTGRLSTRGEENGVSDLATYFGEDSFAFVGNNYPIRLNPKNYELSDTKFLIYRYEYQGSIVSKKIAFEGTEIIVDKNALYTSSSGKQIDPSDVKKVEVYKYDASTKSSSKIQTFKPVFVNEEELKEQLLSVYKISKEELGADNEKAQDELIKFVLDIYGRTDEVALKKWLKENIAY